MVDTEAAPRPGIKDPRWALWRDLRARAGQAAGWEPVTFTRVFDVQSSVGLAADRVEISFDHRLSQAAVISSIKAKWPQLARAHWIRATKVMVSRAEKLIRFVCLDNPPNTSWPELCTRWNAQNEKPNQFKTYNDFYSRFRRAEQQLTGETRGLEWFYDTSTRPEVWKNLTLGELDDLQEGGGRIPVPVRARMASGFGAAAYVIGLALGRYASHARTLSDQGLTLLEIHERMKQESEDWRKFTADEPAEHVTGFINDILLDESEDWPDLELDSWKTNREGK